MSDVSTTSTNMAIARSTASKGLPVFRSGAAVADRSVMRKRGSAGGHQRRPRVGAGRHPGRVNALASVFGDVLPGVEALEDGALVAWITVLVEAAHDFLRQPADPGRDDPRLVAQDRLA